MANLWQQFESQQNFIENISDNSLSALPSQRFIKIEGPDAKQFLQGQLSCDLNKVSPELSSFGSHCNAKGRMQSSFRIFQTGEHCYHLMLHQSIAEAALNALKKYSIFSKATLELSDDLAFAVFGEKAKEALSAISPITITNALAQQSVEGLTAVNICPKTPAFLVFGAPEKAQQLAENLAQTLKPCSESQWQLLQQQLGLAFVESSTADAFIPQQFNYEHTPAISFKKGCYTGQEIVARMHYLGKVKRPMYRFIISSEADIATGVSVDSIDGKTAQGHIVSCTSIKPKQYDVLITATEKLAEAKQWLIDGINADVIDAIALSYPANTNQ